MKIMDYSYTKVPILSVIIAGKYILALVKRSNILSLVMFNRELKAESEVALLNASRGFILGAEKDKILLSIDDKLILIEGDEQKTVLKSSRSENFFWHCCRVKNKVFVQEYGKTPTGTFVSDDFMNWRKLIVNTDLDEYSKHLHYITYDPYREWLIATLGDGCPTRVAFSEDLGNSWNPLYRGPWQFVPAVPLKDRIVFGMDSGIAKGGLGIYYPGEDKWEFIFLRWKDKNIKHAQFCDLKLLDKGLWVASLGTPYAIIASKDLRLWYPLFVESFDEEFNHNMLLSIGEGIIACSTGKNLIILDDKDIKNAFASKPIMVEYKAYWNRLVGYGFSIKHNILDKLWESISQP
jgi:hypothetical protein